DAVAVGSLSVDGRPRRTSVARGIGAHRIGVESGVRRSGGGGARAGGAGARGPRLPQPAPSSLEEAAGPDRGGLRTAILWCGAGVLCTLMDEALVSFGALHLEALGATAVQRGVAFGAATLSAIGALAVVERIRARLGGIRLLLVASGGCAGVFAG